MSMIALLFGGGGGPLLFFDVITTVGSNEALFISVERYSLVMVERSLLKIVTECFPLVATEPLHTFP